MARLHSPAKVDDHRSHATLQLKVAEIDQTQGENVRELAQLDDSGPPIKL